MPWFSAGTAKGKKLYPVVCMTIHQGNHGKSLEQTCSHFIIRNTFVFIDFHSIFSVIKRAGNLSADSLILTVKLFFARYELPSKISDAGGNFVLEKFRVLHKT